MKMRAAALVALLAVFVSPAAAAKRCKAGGSASNSTSTSAVGSGSPSLASSSSPALTSASIPSSSASGTTTTSSPVITSSAPTVASSTSSSSINSNVLVVDGGSSSSSPSSSSASSSVNTPASSGGSSSSTPAAGGASTPAGGSSAVAAGTATPATPAPGSSGISSSAAAGSSSLSISTASGFSASPAASAIPAGDGSTKYVFAHHMVGNTFPYTVSDWTNDINLAHANGIDAFALNIGTDSWQATQVKNAYTAAEASSTGFKLFISFDMTVLPCTSSADGAALRQYITTYASSSAQFKYQGKVFASTFSGETCTFGAGTVVQGWQSAFLAPLTGSNSVFFVPSFFVDPSTFSNYASVMNGQLNWNSAWPITVTTSSMDSLLQDSGATSEKVVELSATNPLTTSVGAVVLNITSSLSSDDAYLSALNKIGNQVYMGTVSPWFFTHYSPQTFNKNFIYLSDQLYPSRWQSIIQNRDQFPMIEIVTWNDYGESSYIGPIEGAQPNSQAWVDGFDHTPFLDMTNYFATAFKTGAYPTPTEDKLYLYARPHARDATATADSVAKPTNADVSEDALFGVVLATADAQVVVAAGGQSETVSVKAGLTQVSLPLTPGDTMSLVMTRNGQTVVQLKPDNFTFAGSTATYNFNAFAAMAGSSSGSGSGSGSSSNATASKMRRHRRRSERWH